MPRLCILLASMSLVAGCAASTPAPAPVPVPSPQARAVPQITVFADDDSAERVARALRAAGYAQVQTSADTDVDLNIKFGGTPSGTLEHVLDVAATTLEIQRTAFRKHEAWGPQDMEIYLNVPSIGICEARPDCKLPRPDTTVRAVYNIVIFSDVPAGRALGPVLLERGYKRAHLSDEPNPELNIKYGGAPLSVVRDVLEQAAEVTGCPYEAFAVRRMFKPDDHDVYVNVGGSAMGEARCTKLKAKVDAPAAASPSAGAPDISIRVFSDGPTGERLLEALRGADFERLSLGDEPNDTLNIKYGAASDALIEAILGKVSAVTGCPLEAFERMKIFAADDGDVFINVQENALRRAGCTGGGRTAGLSP